MTMLSKGEAKALPNSNTVIHVGLKVSQYLPPRNVIEINICCHTFLRFMLHCRRLPHPMVD